MALKRLLTYADFRDAARKALPAPMFHYIDGGADDEWTLSQNTDAFGKYELLPRYLKDMSSIDTRTRVLGADLAAPIILSPTGMNRLFHHEKELAVARAAEKHGLMYSLSTLGTSSIEDVAAVKPGPKMFQIYVHKDRGLTLEFVDRARAAGYDALCLTVDMPVAGNRERDIRTGFIMPPRFTPASFFSFAARPGWSLNLLRDADFRLANVAHRQDALGESAMGVIAYVNSQFDNTVTWDDVAAVIEHWGGPFAIKGIMAADDARRSLDAGASAVMISNHGGRQLDGAPAPIDCVALMRDAVGNELELIVDGGVRRGNHVVRALAAGANAVSFGRPYLFGLAAGGEAGVDRVLKLMKAEVRRTMALVGADKVAEIGPHHLTGQ
ncbi:alpha-hydroxy acid oxidase [Kordiimonas marina]|uniref:alpha-hydroxy acid oxidase n=1 Tax=Kordiimonas marina TaxID=2872312 RepID=UPI001FF43B20|nr:alpha-hydroxy acid oxidase [Kordiimonas marina]MCJ9429536.1 alpha-hydroxy-acid oxidizing protein [Kordiimonas marina]